MELTRPNSQILFTGWNSLFQGAYQATELYWKLFATRIPSMTEAELYNWIAQLPGLEEVCGPAKINNVPLRDYILTNKVFKSNIGLNKWKVKNDQHGVFAPTVTAFGEACARWPDEQVAAAVEAATSAICYDGQPFFDIDHPYAIDNPSLGVYCNNFVGPEYDLEANPVGVWGFAQSKMGTYKGDSGKPLGLRADILMVPPELEMPAKQAARAELIPQAIRNNAGTENVGGAAVSNIIRGDFTVIVNPYLVTKAAYVLCTRKALRPFVWQVRQEPEFITIVDPTDPHVRTADEFLYGAEASGVPGYALPFLAIRLARS